MGNYGKVFDSLKANVDYINTVDLKDASVTLKNGEKTFASANELRKGALSSVRNS